MLISFLAAGIFVVAAPDVAETPAKRSPWVAPPNYPAACMPAPGAEAKPERVTLAYAVDEFGRAADIRVRETTNECFNGPAIDAARMWRFEPRLVNGEKARQDQAETTVTYILKGESSLEDLDARPIFRASPSYPNQCFGKAADRETVILEFDVDPEGVVRDPRIVSSTNHCFNFHATRAAEKWRYAPKIVEGAATSRNGVQVTILFDFPKGVGGERAVRPAVDRALNGVRRELLKEKPDNALIIAELDKIESEYGADFRRLEMASYYPMRAAARLESRNYRGALDDFRVAMRLTASKKSGEAMVRTIAALEAHIAAEDAALAAKTAAPPETAAPAPVSE